MHVYMNGHLRPELEIGGSWPINELPKAANFSATLELGRYAVGNSWSAGSMVMDELLIFQDELPCDDILRLNHNYS